MGEEARPSAPGVAGICGDVPDPVRMEPYNPPTHFQTPAAPTELPQVIFKVTTQSAT